MTAPYIHALLLTRLAPLLAATAGPANFASTPLSEDMRALAVKTVAQSREAYDRSKDAFEASLTTLERSFDAAGQGAAAFNRKIIDIARRNVDASFDLATSLAGAKTFADMLELQATFWRKQLGN